MKYHVEMPIGVPCWSVLYSYGVDCYYCRLFDGIFSALLLRFYFVCYIGTLVLLRCHYEIMVQTVFSLNLFYSCRYISLQFLLCMQIIRDGLILCAVVVFFRFQRIIVFAVALHGFFPSQNFALKVECWKHSPNCAMKASSLLLKWLW